MKYARPVTVGSQVRMYDVVDTDAYNPRPVWGQTDEALLDRIYSGQKEAWVSKGQWFVEVPPRVQDCAVHTGSDYMDKASYLNPDGTTAEDPPSDESEQSA